MKYPEGVRPWKISEFSNVHENFTQKLCKNQSYDVEINTPGFQGLNALEQYNRCTANLQWIINDAKTKQLHVRPLGSGWSLSTVAVCNDAIINTKNLRLKIKLKPENFRPEFLAAGNDHTNFLFLQCGNTVISLNRLLEKETTPAKSLRVSGGSNGQTIVGAFSTGTHGAALYGGSLCDMIVGLHIVTGPDSHVYVERASRIATSETFHNKLGATVIHDDDLFNAALVSFGSFGIIHGVLLEIEDKFLLKQKLRRVTFDAAMEQAVNGDFSGIAPHLPYPLNDPLNRLYHFELAINPHDFAFNDPKKGVYMRSMFKIPLQSYEPIVEEEKYSYGDSTLGLIQSILDMVEKTAGTLNHLLVPKLVNTLFNMAYDRPSEAIGTIGETFSSTKFRGNLFSAAFAIKREDVKKVIETCLQINDDVKLAGVMAFRFVKGTAATLGFARWENSCVLELDGAGAAVNHEFMQKLAEQLDIQNIGYTLHWGKINGIIDKARMKKMFGEDRIAAWKKQRSRIMSPDVQNLFNNQFMETCGLEDYIPYEQSNPIASALVNSRTAVGADR